MSETTESDEPKRVAPQGLKKFMEEFHNKPHLSLETRIMLMFAFAVFAQLMFNNEAEGNMVTYGALGFAGLILLVIVFNTWLDYFPSRLVHVAVRPAYGQGLGLACLLLPTLATACLHRSLADKSKFSGILFLYSNLLGQMCVCTVLATLLHAVPFSTAVMLYNFSTIGVSYVFQKWIDSPMFVSLPALMLFSALVPTLITTFPKSFTLAESVIVSHGLVLLLTDVGLQVVNMFWKTLSLPVFYTRHVAVLYIEFLVSGVFICCLLLCPLLYKLSTAKNHLSIRFWSAAFVLFSLTIGLVFILPVLGTLIGGHHPVPFVFSYLLATNTRICLAVYWLSVCALTGVVVWSQSSAWQFLQVFKSKNPSGLLMRKCFHVSAVCVFIPGLIFDSEFLSLAASMITFLFLVIELMRATEMWPWGSALRAILSPMCDQKDAGPLILSPLYLMIGLSLPLWVLPTGSTAGKLCTYSGVLSLGIGDAMAAVSGSLFGKRKWPATSKTLEGTLMSVLTQLLVVGVVSFLDPGITTLTQRQWLTVTCGIVLTAFLEAYTWQIDNLILAIAQCALFVAFI